MSLAVSYSSANISTFIVWMIYSMSLYLIMQKWVIQADKEIQNLNYYFGRKLLEGNVWFYVIFYITFWWFMRKLTQATEEK